MRITEKAKRGLAVLAGLVGAGTPADILGEDCEDCSNERWTEVLEAVKWIRSLRIKDRKSRYQQTRGRE